MKNIVNIILSILFGLLFLNMGLNKFSNFLPIPEEMPEGMIGMMTLMDAMKETGWLLQLVRVVEVIAGLLFFSEQYRTLASIMIFPITVGILLTHVFNAPDGLPIAAGIMVVNLWFLIDNRKRLMPIIK